MEIARVTSKGQVTVPKRIREALGLARGDLVAFIPSGRQSTVELRRLPARTLSELRGMLKVPRALRPEAERRAYRRKLAEKLAPRRR